MLEGKELEGNIGSVGTYSVDVDADGIVTAGVGFKVDVLDLLEKLAAKTGTTLDDSLVAGIKKLLGRE